MKLEWVAQEELAETSKRSSLVVQGQDEEVQSKTGIDLGKGHKK